MKCLKSCSLNTLQEMKHGKLVSSFTSWWRINTSDHFISLILYYQQWVCYSLMISIKAAMSLKAKDALFALPKWMRHNKHLTKIISSQCKMEWRISGVNWTAFLLLVNKGLRFFTASFYKMRIWEWPLHFTLVKIAFWKVGYLSEE